MGGTRNIASPGHTGQCATPHPSDWIQEMTQQDQERWNERYRSPRWKGGPLPHSLLSEYAGLLTGGLALDLACGLGQNALWLAEHGYRVIAVDISRVALRRGLKAARRQGLADRVLFVQADLDHFRPPAESCDLICVFRFLNRGLFPAIRAALRPGGVLIYATLNWRRAQTHPDVPREYLLRPGELGRAFGEMEIIAQGENGETSHLIARRRREY
ncbi:MAG TPA: class I SAM-dependent methyltransferase [Chloroflexi bacterium]|nr:class I SAM-dependent methyltransferase [Chloroflexota bacterium]